MLHPYNVVFVEDSTSRNVERDTLARPLLVVVASVPLKEADCFLSVQKHILQTENVSASTYPKEGGVVYVTRFSEHTEMNLSTSICSLDFSGKYFSLDID